MSMSRARARAIAFTLLVLAASASCTGTPATSSVSPSDLSPTPTPSQMSAEAREYLKFALSKIRTYDFYAREADWPSLEQGAYLRASGAADSSDVYPAIRWVLRSLGDGHGFVFLRMNSMTLRGSFTEPRSRQRVWSGKSPSCGCLASGGPRRLARRINTSRQRGVPCGR
jgi:hypothetical protein